MGALPLQISPADPACLEVESLSLSYGTRPALRDVSLQIRPRQITAIIGPSGCGKSSLLFSINRMVDLIPGCRVQGRVRIGALDVYGQRTDLGELRRRVALILQKPSPFPFSVRRNITVPLRDQKRWHRHDLEGVMEQALRQVGLWDEVCCRLDESALALSGGQQQRLCIARALALDPEVILLDEPCSALDPLAAARVEDLILELRGARTIVVVTHNLAQAQRIADRVAVFWVRGGAGTLIEQGSKERVFGAPQDALTWDYIHGVRG